jgi:glutathione synthase/RimK-type ligase-like ATP-grasp enzyme
MLVGIHKERYGKFPPTLQIYEQILHYNKIKTIQLESDDGDFWEKVKELDLFIFLWGHVDDHHQLAKTIIPIVQNEYKVKCYPDLNTCWHYDDKIRQYYLLKAHGFPYIDSFIFWNRGKALEWACNATLPVIFKLKSGAGSKNVLLIKSKMQLKYYIKKMFARGIKPERISLINSTSLKDFRLKKNVELFARAIYRKFRNRDFSSYWSPQKNYVLLQRFLPNNDFDTRITIIGNRAFGFRRFVRKNDFRASGSGKINYELDKIDLRTIRIAFIILKNLGFQSMAFDFLLNEGGEPEIAEISYIYQDKAIFNCPGYWDDKLNFHEGHYWPQYFHLVDALGLPDLKQPEIKLEKNKFLLY